MKLTMSALAEILSVGALAADLINPCPECGAESGALCSEMFHSVRIPGDPVLASVLRAMADRTVQMMNERT